MNIGKLIRINRLFSSPSEKFLSIAVDHFIGYQDNFPEGLRQIGDTLQKIVTGAPDALTMHRGLLKSAWSPYAGKIPVILQSMIARPDDSAFEYLALPEDAIRLGADAFAVAIFVRGDSEASHLRLLADMVREAEKFDLPLICHIYPRDVSVETKVSFKAEDIAWAVRCALESGADIIKVPYCGDIEEFRQIVNQTQVPIVAAGGPKADSFEAALQMISDVIQSGAKGATIGRNVWGFSDITGAVKAFKRVVHENSTVAEALTELKLRK